MKTLTIEITLKSERHDGVTDTDYIDIPMSILEKIFNDPEEEYNEDDLRNYIDDDCEIDTMNIKEQDYCIEADGIEEIDYETGVHRWFDESWGCIYHIDINEIREEYNKIKQGEK